MRLRLDECTPRRLKREFAGHETLTIDEAGLKGLKNGELLRAASSRFDVLITVDKNLPYQQNPASLPIAIVIPHAKRNSYDALKLLIPQALEALEKIEPGAVVRIALAPPPPAQTDD